MAMAIYVLILPFLVSVFLGLIFHAVKYILIVCWCQNWKRKMSTQKEAFDPPPAYCEEEPPPTYEEAFKIEIV